MTESIAYTHYAGVDWASESHQVHVRAADGTPLGDASFAHSGPGLLALTDWLCERTGAAPADIGVAIETSSGPVVEVLLAGDFPVHAMNPKQSKRFRELRGMSGAKDDPRDARLLAEALHTAPHCLRRVTALPPAVHTLRPLVRHRDRLKTARTQQATHLRQTLWEAHPALLPFAGNGHGAWYLALCERAPTPADAATLTDDEATELCRRYGKSTVEPSAVVAALQAPAMDVNPGTLAATADVVRDQVRLLRVLNEQIRASDRRLVAQVDAVEAEAIAAAAAPTPADAPPRLGPRDVAVLRAEVGLGTVGLATMLGFGYDPIVRRDRHAFRSLAAVAPVTQQSGTGLMTVRRRRAAHRGLRDVCYHWARVGAMREPRMRAAYKERRAKGERYAHVLRTIADRQIRACFARLRDGDPYRKPATPKAA